MTGLEWWRLFPRAMRKIAMFTWIFDLALYIRGRKACGLSALVLCADGYMF